MKSLSVNDLTPEFRISATCSWIPSSENLHHQQHLIDSANFTSMDWAKVVRLVAKHGIVGQFCTIMGRREWRGVPAETREQLRALSASFFWIYLFLRPLLWVKRFFAK